MFLLVEAGCTILQEDGREVVAQSIHHRREHAEFDGDACHDDSIHSVVPKGLIQVRLEESAESPLR